MNELIDSLKNGIVEIVFTKINGDKRVMKATLQETYLPEIEEKSILRKPNSNTTSVWSIEDNGWRAFKNDSVISWTIVE